MVAPSCSVHRLQWLLRGASTLSILGAVLVQAPAHADVTGDGTLGTTVSAGPVYDISGGTQVGTNVFHSFDSFSITEAETANFNCFNGCSGRVDNFIGRVTGDTISTINGTISSGALRANIFLINPNGVVLGPNARVDVNGVFAASSASSVETPSGCPSACRFDRKSTASTLSSAHPTAFGFLDQGSAAQISFGGDFVSARRGPRGTRDTPGKNSMSLDAELTLSQRFDLVAWNSDISLTASSRIETGSSSINIATNRTLLLDGGGGASSNLTTTAGTSGAGDIFLKARDLTLTNGGQIMSRTFGDKSSGDIFINASRSLVVDARNSQSDTGIFNRALADSTGSGGDVHVDAQSVFLAGFGAQILTETSGIGDGGDVSVNAGEVSILGGAIIAANTIPNSKSAIQGAGGRLDIAAHNLLIDAQGSGKETGIFRRATNADGNGVGRGGDTHVDAQSILLEGYGAQIAALGFEEGAVWIGSQGRVGILRLTNGATIRAYGGVGVNVGYQDPSLPTGNTAGVSRVEVSGYSDSATSRRPSGIFTGKGGQAGPLRVLALDEITLTNGATLSATPTREFAPGPGSGGDIFIDAPLVLLDQSIVGSGTTGGTEAGAFKGGNIYIGSHLPVDLLRVRGGGVTASSSRRGAGGTIFILAKEVDLLDRATLSVASGSGERAGKIFVRAQQLKASSGAVISAKTGFNGLGQIAIEAGTIALEGGAQVTTDTVGASAGDIFLRGGRLEIFGAGTLVSSRAPNSITSVGDAGNIYISAVDFRIADGAEISTFAQRGGGGSITIDWNHVGRVEDASITTNVLSSSQGAGTISFGTSAPIEFPAPCPGCSPAFFDPYVGVARYVPGDPLKVLIVGNGSKLDASAKGAEGAPGGTIEIVRGVSTIVSGGILPADVSSETGSAGEVTTPVAFVPSRAVSLFAPERKVAMRCGITHEISTLFDNISGHAMADQDPSFLPPAGLPEDLEQLLAAAARRLCGV